MNDIILRIIQIIESWNESDIYTLSIYFDYNDNIDMYEILLGYNTEKNYSKSLKNTDKDEAKWNYAFWLQNDKMIFNELDIYEEKEFKSIDEEIRENIIINKIIKIIREVHNKKILTTKFSKELPIIIHELEYYPMIANYNIEANGIELIENNFINFCGGIEEL